MSGKHDDIVNCIRKIFKAEGKQKEVDGFIDAFKDEECYEVELSGSAAKFGWAFLKLSKCKKGILFVPKEHLEKARKIQKSYGFDNIAVKEIPTKCVLS